MVLNIRDNLATLIPPVGDSLHPPINARMHRNNIATVGNVNPLNTNPVVVPMDMIMSMLSTTFSTFHVMAPDWYTMVSITMDEQMNQ